MKRRGLLLLVMVVVGAPAFSALKYSLPMPVGPKSVSVDTTLPSPDLVPPLAVSVPETSFIMIQGKGGSILLGPMLGAANIKAKTNALAKQSAGGYMAADIAEIGQRALVRISLDQPAPTQAYWVKPLAYVRHCSDGEVIRVLFAFHVQGKEGKKPWMGRYVVPLPTAIPISRFAEPTEVEVTSFESELSAAAVAAAELLARDMKGELAATGRPVAIGSVFLPGGEALPDLEKLVYRHAYVLDERDEKLIVRPNGLPGGPLFGVFELDRSQVHTLKDE